MLRISIKNLRKIIRENWYLENYEKNLVDDESFNKESVYVPNETKEKIKSWFADMGLSRKNKK